MEEIAEKMGVPLHQVQKILKVSKKTVSLETPVGEEEDSRLEDFIEDKGSISPRMPPFMPIWQNRLKESSRPWISGRKRF